MFKARAVVLDCALIVVALLLHPLTPSPAVVERYYSNGFYPVWDTIVRSVTDRIPISLDDVLAPALLIWLVTFWIVRLRRAFIGRPLLPLTRRPLIVLARTLLDTAAVFAAIFIWFMVSWAFNYSRIPVKEKMVLHKERTGVASVTALANRTIAMLNANVAAAHAEHLDDAQMQRDLEPTFYPTIHRLGDLATFAPTPIKPTLFEPLMRATATFGFTDPWTHEINLSSALFPYERPAAYAHEWSHLSGFADESEANFIATVSCIHSRDAALRYSGWMLVWFNLPSSIRVTTHPSAAVLADAHAIEARYDRLTRPGVARVQRAVYNSYLHANNVKAGYDSYQLFVQLLTAGEFDKDGLPVVKPTPPAD
ncbi:MAG TPA: DUF3810 family protein [Candidatus Acidoferrales bacterium]|nr:DUF3810 family protein [Candidatus Acidoferrales bacterium]